MFMIIKKFENLSFFTNVYKFFNQVVVYKMQKK